MKKNLITVYFLSLNKGEIFYSNKPDKFFTSIGTKYNIPIKTERGFFINKEGHTEKILKVTKI